MLIFLFTLIITKFSFSASDYVISNRTFPQDFMFGVATSSYQIEGAWNEDGKGESIWDNFVHNHPGKIFDQSNGDIACDSYHQYETDVAMLKDLGVSHYIFSIAWTRILPNGFADNINEAGIEYYANLIQLLNENNIVPIVTLYHWDLPQVLQDYGGFLNSSIADWFADYARVCFENFGEAVTYWLTFNEPSQICSGGYGVGKYAPGISWPAQGDYICGHNLIRAHAAAWNVYNQEFRENFTGHVTMTYSSSWYAPATESLEDQDASERKMLFELGWWTHPIYFGDYPEIMKIRIANRSRLEGFNESRLPEFTEDENLFIKGTSDYFAFNAYSSYWVKAIPEPEVIIPPSVYNDIGVEVVTNLTDTDLDASWGLPYLLRWIQNHYNNTLIIITGNGFENWEGIDDFDRIKKIQECLSKIVDAIEDDIIVFGYTLWSLMDNFQWTSGYSTKMGIYEVDFLDPNKTRTARKSALWYKRIMQTRCLLDICE